LKKSTKKNEVMYTMFLIYVTYTPYARKKKEMLLIYATYIPYAWEKKGKKKVDINKRIMLGSNQKQE